jgi:pimeloyl-ACP methyl ester carboxylesterase
MTDPSLLPGERIELPGRGTTFVRDLAGPPGAPAVVLLHGLLATADLNWSGAYEALSAHVRVVAVDHRGHGQGIRSRGRFRLEDCADDAVAVADMLGLRTFVPVGYSMGGLIAQLVWHRHPTRVDGLVLCATSRNFRGHPRDRFMFGALAAANVIVRLTPGQARRRLVERTLAGRVEGPEGEWAWSEFQRNDLVKMVEAARALGHYSSHHWIETVDVPTAVVVTTHDQLVPARRQRKLAASIPGATVHEVEGDHAVAVREPSAFVPVLVDALLDVSSRMQARV